MQRKKIEVLPYSYRPFDTRYVCYDEDLVERRRYDLMQHLEKGDNIAMLVGRAGQNVEGMWNLCFICDKITDANLFLSGRRNGFSAILLQWKRKRYKWEWLFIQ